MTVEVYAVGVCLNVRDPLRLIPHWTRLRFDPAAAIRHNVVEYFNNQGLVMSTVNFSVPEDIKNAFNTVFEGQNKSAVIADLMRDAVEREQRRKQHCSAVDRILANRINAPRFSEGEFRAAREEGRP
jgi:hypothetical protein